MNSRLLLNVLRLLSLAGAAAAVTTAWSWETLRNRLDPIDEALIARHLEGPERALAEAVDALRAGDRKAGIDRLLELARSLRGVRLGARLEHVRTTTLETLTAELVRAERLDEALAWTTEFLEYDPRDFPARLRRADVHRRLGNDAEELSDLEAAYAVGAASGAAVAPYVDAMARRGDREAVATALLDLGDQGPLVLPLTGWEFRAAPGPDFAFEEADPMALTARPVAQAAPDEPGAATPYGWSLDASADPRTMQGLRVDLPGGCQMVVGALRMELIAAGGQRATLDLGDLVVANQMETLPSGALLATGQADPYVILMAKEAPALTGVTAVHVTMELGPFLGQGPRELFLGGIDAEERARWSERYGAEAVRTLEAGLGQ